jgi:hypothetical protein
MEETAQHYENSFLYTALRFSLPFQNFMSHIEIFKFCQNHWSLAWTVTVLMVLCLLYVIFFDLLRYCLWKFITRRKLPRIIELTEIFTAMLGTILMIKPKFRAAIFNNRLIANVLQALG